MYKLLTIVLCLSWSLQLFAQSPISNKHWQFLHLPGIGGERMIDQSFVRGMVIGLQSRHITVQSKIYDWTDGEDGLLALSDVVLHQRESGKVAAQLIDLRRANPHDFILLTSHSGGAGIAAWALKQLPSDVEINEWIMLAPAISPYFDLSDSLTHVSGPTFSFNSVTDLVLGTGTRLFGTVDRVKTDAGGRVGFQRPLFGDPIQYAKLQNIPYDANWLHYGNAGDHIGPMLGFFARKVVAPTAFNEQLSADPLPASKPK